MYQLTKILDSSTETAAAYTLSRNILSKVKAKRGELYKHALGVFLYIVGQADGAAATGLWADNLNAVIKSFKLSVCFPDSEKEFNYFDLEGEGVRLLSALSSNKILDPQIALANNQPIIQRVFLPFARKGFDTDFPNAIPMSKLGTVEVEVDPTLKDSDTTWDSLAMYLRIPYILAEKEMPFNPRSWKQDNTFTDYSVEHRTSEILKACYLCNAIASNANRLTSFDCDALEQTDIDGRELLAGWVDDHPFSDIQEAAELVTTAGDYGFPLLEQRWDSPSSGIRGPVEWTWDSNGGPQTNQILKCVVPELARPQAVKETNT